MRLKASALFREDQYSYVLYPNKSLPRFLDKNNIDPEALAGSKLLSQVGRRRECGHCDPGLHGWISLQWQPQQCQRVARSTCAHCPSPMHPLVASEQKQIEAIYEGIFNHKSFHGPFGHLLWL